MELSMLHVRHGAMKQTCLMADFEAFETEIKNGIIKLVATEDVTKLVGRCFRNRAPSTTPRPSQLPLCHGSLWAQVLLSQWKKFKT